MEVLHQTSEKLVVRMPARETLANALRRSITEIPVLAIDEVEIYKNDSALYDEMLAHRIGLVPLKNEGALNDKTEIALKFSKKGPCMVYAEDLEGGAEPVYPKTPLVLLEKEQELEFIAKARVGRGVEHEKYTPGLGFYRHLVLVNSKNMQVQKMAENAHGLVKPEKTKDGWLCDLHESLAEEISLLDAGALHDAEEIVFVIESFGQMAAKDIMLKAVRALGENVEAFEKALS